MDFFHKLSKINICMHINYEFCLEKIQYYYIMFYKLLKMFNDRVNIIMYFFIMLLNSTL